jgi:hypothetical protein
MDNEAELGEDGALLIKFNMKVYDTWSKTRVKYCDLKRKAKLGSVWTCVTLRSADPEVEDGPFELRCHACDKRCQLGNPSKWFNEHECMGNSRKAVAVGRSVGMQGKLPTCATLFFVSAVITQPILQTALTLLNVVQVDKMQVICATCLLPR